MVQGSTLIGLYPGRSQLVIRHPKLNTTGSVWFNVSNKNVTALYLDPQIINSVTVSTSPTLVQAVSKQTALLTTARPLFFRGQRADVAVSVLFSDGTRQQLSTNNGGQVSFQSLNTSWVQVRTDPLEQFPHLRAIGMANGDVIEAQWSVCGWTTSGTGYADIVVNLYKPVFNATSTIVNIPEDTKVGSLVTRVQAIDFDVNTIHSNILYSFVSGNDDNRFTINETSGEIKLALSLDHEVTDLHTLVVQATDQEQRLALAGSDGNVTTDSDLLDPSTFTVGVFYRVL